MSGPSPLRPALPRVEKPSLRLARCLRRHHQYYASIRHPGLMLTAPVVPRRPHPPVTTRRTDQGFLGSSAILACVMWPSTPPERRCLAMAAPLHVAFDGRHCFGLCDLSDYVAQSHTCVRFRRAVTGRTRNTHYEAVR